MADAKLLLSDIDDKSWYAILERDCYRYLTEYILYKSLSNPDK